MLEAESLLGPPPQPWFAPPSTSCLSFPISPSSQVQGCIPGISHAPTSFRAPMTGF